MPLPARIASVVSHRACVMLMLAAAASALPLAARAQDEAARQCGERAAQRLHDDWPSGIADTGVPSARIEAHYSARRDRCYHLESTSEWIHSPALKRNVVVQTQRLWDDTAMSKIGEWQSWNEDVPAVCWLAGRTCQTTDQWQHWLATYLQD